MKRSQAKKKSKATAPPAMDDRSSMKPKPKPKAGKSSVRVAPKASASASGGEDLRIPHDIVNEQVVFAASLVDVETCDKLLRILTPDSFFGKGHPEAWAMLADLRRRGLTYDPATVRQLSGGAIDVDYFEGLIEDRPAVPPNLSHHVETMEWDRKRVECARGPLGSLLDAVRDPTADPERVRTLATQVKSAFDQTTLRYLRDPDELVRAQMAEIRKRREGLARFSYGLEGFMDYEDGSPRIIPGAAPKQVTVITGLSGGGKTTAVAHMALGFANAKRKTLFGAWEQGSGLTLELIATLSLHLSRTKLTIGDIDDETLDDLEAEMKRIAQWVRFFEIPFGRKQGEKRLNDRSLDIIQAYIVESGCEIFIADLWRRALRQFDPDEEEQALYRQQTIAQETNTHHILIHQQRLKDVETRADKQPTREGLKGSGAWVEMPDTIIGIHRPALWKAVADDSILGLILKQRHGIWPLAVEFNWEPTHGMISGGRSIDYIQPGQEGEVDSFLAETAVNKKRRRR
jgi:replicative DNA helicase